MSKKRKESVKIVFKGEELHLDFNQSYSNGRLAIQALGQNGLPFLRASVNLPNEPLEDNEIFIKDYAENEGVLKVLVENGIVEPISKVQIGYVAVDKCKLIKTE